MRPVFNGGVKARVEPSFLRGRARRTHVTSSLRTASLVTGTFVGEYQITGSLGEGGMGIVYAGVHPEIGKRVAIKVLAPFAATHPDLIRRFKEEARAVNRIRHPNIIDIFAFNQLADGRHYFVMEYLEGESFGARLSRGTIPLPLLRRLLEQICSALQAAHREGVVHRDLKPDNIWVATEGSAEPRIKLLDFGIAKLLDVSQVSPTQSGIPLGTPHYMSPEQAMGRAVDARADIYALGVILYKVFTGRIPFEGATAHEIAMKHSIEAPVPPSRYLTISPEIEQVILDCLEKDPGRRPQTVDDLWGRIDKALAKAELQPASSAARQGSGPVSQRTELLPDSQAPRTEAMPEPTPAAINRTIELPSSSRSPGPSPAAGSAGPARAANTSARRLSKSLIFMACAGVLAVAIVMLARRGRPDGAGTTSGPARVAPTPPASAEITGDHARVEERSTELALPNVAPTHPVPSSSSVPRESQPAKVSGTRRGERVRKSDRPAAVAKPNCDPNFTLDAQGEKHFKPECF